MTTLFLSSKWWDQSTGKKEAHILLKLDISKAFHSVSWPLLLEVLRHVGFGQRWRDLICLILSTSTQVLVNGEPRETILHRRNLRQGDPLSPILSILVMDVLNSIINMQQENSCCSLWAFNKHDIGFWTSYQFVQEFSFPYPLLVGVIDGHSGSTLLFNKKLSMYLEYHSPLVNPPKRYYCLSLIRW
jgi:hypothetical protein